MWRFCGAVLAIVLFLTTPASALFVNGGFETGDFTGWTVRGGLRMGGSNFNYLYWDDRSPSAAVIGPGVTQDGQTLVVNPYNGTKMARINDIYGWFGATMITQTDIITAEDIASGGVLYINWGAMLVEPENVHPTDAQPFFGLDVLVNGIPVDSFFATADLKQGGGWVKAGIDWTGSDLWYKSGTYSYNLNSFAIGDSVTIRMYVADCDWGAHGGFAFLDGVGTTYQPPGVPEPATMLLLGAGLVGVGILRRRGGR